MSEHRTTERNVRELATDVAVLAREMGLIPTGHSWFIEPGSPTYGRLWRLYGLTESTERYYPYFTNGGVLGKTAKQAHDFLEVVSDVLIWVQGMQEEQ